MTENELLALSAEELREELISAGLSKRVADDIKGKNNLRSKLKEMVVITEEDIEDIDISDENDTDQETPVLRGPTVLDPEWHDYVMSHFTDSEVFVNPNGDKLPKLPGLRRVSQKLIGRIVQNETIITGRPSMENGFMAIAESTIAISSLDGEILVYKDVSDCTPENTDPPFNKHLTPSAASKAESRNLRKILQLNSISAEEYTQKTAVDNSKATYRIEGGDEESFVGPTQITDGQIEIIDKIAEELNVDVMKFVNQKDKQYASISDVENTTAISILKTLHNYRNKEDGFQTVPADFIGYQKGWK